MLLKSDLSRSASVVRLLVEKTGQVTIQPPVQVEVAAASFEKKYRVLPALSVNTLPNLAVVVTLILLGGVALVLSLEQEN